MFLPLLALALAGADTVPAPLIPRTPDSVIVAVASRVDSAHHAQAGAKPAPLAPGLYYARRSYGTESQFNPLSEVLNEGFDMLRVNGANHRLDSLGLDNGFRMVGRSMLHPFDTYRQYGVWRAIRNEIIPMTVPDGQGGGAWMPNYEFHLLGSGMVSARMTEWYEQHGYPHPGIFAAFTMAAAHLTNEALENQGTGYSEDCLSDLYVFDPAGFLLFRSERVRRFFSETVQLTNWPGQPTYDPVRRRLENTGQEFILRAKVPHTENWRVFYAFGVGTLVGVSRNVSGTTAVSLAGGADAVADPVVAANGARTSTFQPNAGLFVDRDGSLLFSVIRSSLSDARWVMNVYPGVLRQGALSPGLWVQMLPHGGFRAGVVGRLGLGLGGAHIRAAH